MGLGEYIGLSCILFGIGTVGFLIRRNILVQLMSIELMLNAVNVALVSFNRWHPGTLGDFDHSGQVFAFFVIAVAAAEAAVGLAIVLSLFRLKKSVASDLVDQLRY
ncbi:MAG: NADH-quinone oxidoreductase subunit NuoK [Myxococcota bacterium]